MRIERIEYVVVASGKARTWMFVEVYTDEGLLGVGEASQSRLDEGVAAELRALAPLYIGHDPFELIEDRSRLLRRPDAGRTLHCAVSGLEQALWDICGQASGQPVHRLLGGAVRREIPLYANVALAAQSWTPGPVAEAAAAAVAQGFKAVKFNLFALDNGRQPLAHHDAFRGALTNAVEMVREVRAAVGPDVDILTDWTLAVRAKDALAVAEALAEYRLMWIEEPFVFGHPAELAEFRQAIGQPRLAVGEQLLKRSDFRLLLEARAADVIMPDVKWIGGILEARKLAAMAETFSVEITPHNMSGPVATAASAQLSAVCPNFLILEHCWGADELRMELVGGSERIENGALALSTAPGLGVEWRPAAARKRALGSGVAGRSR